MPQAPGRPADRRPGFSTCAGLRYSPPHIVRRSHATKLLVWLCLLLQLSGTAIAFGTVLCVASDGHVALEVAHPGSCATETRRHHDPAAHDEDTHDAVLGEHCGEHPCTDIALGQTAWRSMLRSPDALAAPHGLIARLLPAATDPVAIRASIGGGLPPRPDARVHDRRTIVLRN
jgi:hypothetical protein